MKGRLPDLPREALLDIERTSGLSDAKLQEWDKRLKTSRAAGKKA